MAKARLELSDTTTTMLVKMSGGNTDVITVLADMLRKGGNIDPDDFMGGMGSVLFLDTLGIYGEKIWMLHNDICDQDMVQTIGLLRACQLGFLPQRELISAINHPSGYGKMDQARIDSLMKQVRERLPQFRK
ncbi:hypothetical protein [Acinetobacter sp.]|uniref:hypothetical protein n=1 Tax=Acinetobacter sp. TaxID=472 RepID=UPI00388F88D1